METTPVTEIPNVVKAIDESLAAEIQKYPINANHASRLGHPCLRYLVYRRTNWKDARAFTIQSKRKMEDGNVHEKDILTKMEKAGFNVICQQKYFKWDKYNITGRMDGILSKDRREFPFEIKSMDTYGFQSIDTAEDFKKRDYFKTYLTQLNLYLLSENKEDGFFILKDRNQCELKQVNIKLDYEIAESAVKAAETVNKHVTAGTYPDRIRYCNTCKFCEYKHICLDGIENAGGLEVYDDAETAQLIKRMKELEPGKKEYEGIHKKIKTMFNKKNNILVGDYLITGEERERKGYTVEPCTYWTMDIEAL